jgi:hypothetical protein
MSHTKTLGLYFVIGITLAYVIAGFEGAFYTAILAVLEVSLSFDNAIVNAKELQHMEEKWRQRFLTWGMLIAVVGMRLLFPLLIVGIVASISPWEALHLAMFEPDNYKKAIESAHVNVMGFGGAFLFMVFLRFFLDGNKEVHWLDSIEKRLTGIGKSDMMEVYVTLLLSVGVSWFLYQHTLNLEEAYRFLVSSVLGIITYVSVDIFRNMLGVEDDVTGTIIRSGLASFVYLEVLDSSFSFDGVIGAFAITNSLFIISIGLGIGALAVRTMTIMLVEKGTLAEYRYLEHGAFWAIGCLATIMYIDTFFQVPEVITGIMGAGVIGLALASSILYKDEETDTL